jgi:hypothetical protein
LLDNRHLLFAIFLVILSLLVTTVLGLLVENKSAGIFNLEWENWD